MIFYFSGTGNSEYTAKKIAAVIDDRMYSINAGIMSRKIPKTEPEEVLIFVTPTYAWRIPKLVEEWIRAAKSFRKHKAYFVMTCGSDIGNAPKYVKRLCRSMGMQYMGCQGIVMPENYIALFDAPNEAESIQIIENALPVIEETAEHILKGEELPGLQAKTSDRLKSGIVNTAFYPLIVKASKFYATGACISCGECVKVCPLGNIKLKGGRPEWGAKCTHCMACISNCPMQAIEYGNVTMDRVRYKCPL